MTEPRFAWWGDDKAAEALYVFHRELHGEAADKAGRAALRRARSPDEAALIPVVGVLRHAIRDEQIKLSDEDIDVAAMLVASIEKDWRRPETRAGETDAGHSVDADGGPDDDPSTWTSEGASAPVRQTQGR